MPRYDYVRHREKIGNRLITIGNDDFPDSPDAWADDDCFLGEQEGYSIGDKSWSKSRCEGHTKWGEGPWESVYGMHVPPERYQEDDDESVETWREARELYEDWLRSTYLDFDEETETYVSEPEYEFYPVRLRDHGSNGMDLVECDWDRATGFAVVRRGSSPMDRLRLGLECDTPQQRVDRLIALWDQYLQGDIWAYDVRPIVDGSLHLSEEDLTEEDLGEVEESCGGFYGSEYAIEDARSMAKWLIKHDEDKQLKLFKMEQEVQCGNHQ